MVIGIIALLISILLPALNKARRSAATVQCASNMRQVSAAMLSYFIDNKGKLFPETVNYGQSTIYPNGWFWATELVGQHYLRAPWATFPAGWTPSSFAGASQVPTSGNVFWCPQCNDDADSLGVPVGLVGSPANAYPTYALNNACARISNNTNVDQNFGAVGIATWYMPFARISTIEGGKYPTVGTANDDPPFIWYADSTADADLRNQNGSWTRTLSMVKHSAAMVLLLEGNSAETCYQDGSGNLTYSWARSLAGRHGHQTSNTRASAASPPPPTRIPTLTPTSRSSTDTWHFCPRHPSRKAPPPAVCLLPPAAARGDFLPEQPMTSWASSTMEIAIAIGTLLAA